LSGRADKFLKLTSREKLLFLEAVVLHLWVGLLLKAVPFRRIPGLFGGPDSSGFSLRSNIVEQVRAAIQRGGSVSPWKNRCLVSSLAARRMLNRRKIPSQLSLGVAKNAFGKTVAHAWLISGETEVTGKHGDYRELVVF
jgi:hypothetical protein